MNILTRFVRLPTLLMWLTVLWVALWGDLSWGNVVSGLAVAAGVLLVARPTGVNGLERTYFRPLSALVYAAYFLVQLVWSNLVVAWEIITPGTSTNRAIVAIPMHTLSPGVVTLVANTITLTPGTVTIDVREATDDAGEVTSRTLYVHVLRLDDVNKVRRDVLRLERLAVKAFGSLDDVAACDDELARLDAATEGASG